MDTFDVCVFVILCSADAIRDALSSRQGYVKWSCGYRVLWDLQTLFLFRHRLIGTSWSFPCVSCEVFYSYVCVFQLEEDLFSCGGAHEVRGGRVPPPSLGAPPDSLTSVQQRRRHVVAAIIHSENSYVATLQRLVNVSGNLRTVSLIDVKFMPQSLLAKGVICWPEVPRRSIEQHFRLNNRGQMRAS